MRGWLAAGDLTGVTVDDGRSAHRLVEAGWTDIGVLFSAGSRVAFRAVRQARSPARTRASPATARRCCTWPGWSGWPGGGSPGDA